MPNDNEINDKFTAFSDSRQFFVIGIGASAGGLQPLQEFFEHIPTDIDVAFVVIQHLSPNFESLMPELLQRKTKLPILTIEDGMKIESNKIYVIPPSTNLVVKNETLYFRKRESGGVNLPIDVFFKSLAQEYGNRTMGILLSGGGRDGSEGLRAIGEAGGLALIQSPETVAFSEMTENAIPMGLVDEILSPTDLAQAISEIVRISKNIPLMPDNSHNMIKPFRLNQILELLSERENLKFFQYKVGTLSRRIYHRCYLTGYRSLEAYIQYLEESTNETKLLAKDLLIGSTGFFRDTEAFNIIEKEVLPNLIHKIQAHEQLRIWVAGCATGEEAYSIAIIVDEAIKKLGRRVSFKIFATDIDSAALESASRGLYTKSMAKDISEERLKNYFIEKNGCLQIKRQLREMLIFAPHDLAYNAGFSKMNLVTCRNVLIYMKSELQQQVLRMLHYSLASEGVLFLGSAEVLGTLQAEFLTINSKWKIYKKQRESQLDLTPIIRQPLSLPILSRGKQTRNQLRWDSLLTELFKFCFANVPTTCVVVNDDNQLMHVFFNTANLLTYPLGETKLGITNLIPKPLQLPLSTALHRAKREKRPVLYSGIKLMKEDEDLIRNFNLKVGLASNDSQYDELYIVVLEEEKIIPVTKDIQTFEINAETINQISELEYELQQTRENLQATIEELETTNEEQQATNEELIASNEELQSTNEELHSVNEELYTVNAEFQSKIQELTELNTDMDNLLFSTEIGVVFLNQKLNIRKFTPASTKLINLKEGDIGRPLKDLSHNINVDKLDILLKEVLQSRKTIEKEICLLTTGDHFLMRIHPYWNENGNPDGLVLTFVDINETKRAQNQLQLITDALPVWISYVDDQQCYRFNNKTYENWFNQPAQEIYGLQMKDVLGIEVYGQIHEYIEEALTGETVTFDLKFPPDTKINGQKSVNSLWVNIVYVPHILESGKVVGFFVLMSDISDRKAIEKFKDEFISMVSHELRTPVTAISGALQLLTEHSIELTSEKGKKIVKMASDSSQRLVRLIQDILTIERLKSSKIDLEKQLVNASQIMLQAQENMKIMTEKAEIKLLVSEQDIEFEADGDLLLDVFTNIIENAIKFSPENATICLSVKTVLGKNDKEVSSSFISFMPSVVFEIQDEGLGIPPDELERIFEPFYQVDSSNSRQKGGTGLGLAICRHIIKMHNGEIWAESNEKGSCFYVSIPLSMNNENHDF